VVAPWAFALPAVAVVSAHRPAASTTPSTVTSTTSTTLPAPIGDPATTSTTVRSIQLNLADPNYLDGVSARLRRAEEALTTAQMDQRSIAAAAAAAGRAADDATNALTQMDTKERAAIAEVQRTRAHLRDLAVSAYVAGGPASPINALLRASSVDEFTQRHEVISTVAASDLTALRHYDSARKSASAAALGALDKLRRAQIARHGADLAVVGASEVVAQKTSALADSVQLLQLVTAAVGYPGTDIPRLVLDAYRRAATSVQQRQCQLPWTALAAVGRVESDHGRAQGAHLTINGDIVPPIVGPPLDGQSGAALVPDTDHGRWDGDTVYEHAIGPMQFLPSTWAVVGRDGNGDGVADPNNIYDAALGAANYLCRAAPPDQLNTDTGLSQAFHSYNHSDAYTQEVLALFHAYASVSLST
jgi:membrane-bound lytic murein transglycosylase B